MFALQKVFNVCVVHMHLVPYPPAYMHFTSARGKHIMG